MLRMFSFILILSCFLPLQAQNTVARYFLNTGQKFFLTQVMTQNTETENGEIKGNVSLDIQSTIEFEVAGIDQDGDYFLDCKYSHLVLSFFSPQEDMSISSQSNAFIPLRDSLEKLEDKTFSVVMSKFGEFLWIGKLDSTINSFYTDAAYDPVKHELILKTIMEAFGEEALASLANISMYVYAEVPTEKYVHDTEISFNAKAVAITNNLYYMGSKDDKLRVQGIGMIHETQDSLQIGEMSIVTVMQGTQTYDYLFNGISGWMIEGVSKQKIHSLSIIWGHEELPNGLKIPSLTESEFQFRGGEIPD